MNDKMMNRVAVLLIGCVWTIITLLSWFHIPQEISVSERRKLKQFPEVSIKNLVSADFMDDFEQYAKDQFPNRFFFRTLKAYTRFYSLGQKDNNGIYIEDGYAVKLDYPLNEASIQKAAEKFKYLYDKYMKEKDVSIYFSIVPDKGYFLSEENGYPSMDYQKLFEIMKSGMDFAQYIDITDTLTVEDYYRTDIHWRQEGLKKAADAIRRAMGKNRAGGADNSSVKEGGNGSDYTEIKAERPFYGVYYGHAALPMKPDTLIYLTNEIIDGCSVYNLETDAVTPVYDTKKLAGNDPYDVYLSGAAPLLVITNPKADTDKELVVFRDSFGSSLSPLLVEEYSKVTLVDIRYISSDLLGNYLTFDRQDVLFLYSSSILNSSAVLK